MTKDYLLSIPEKVIVDLIKPFWPGALTIILPCKKEKVSEPEIAKIAYRQFVFLTEQEHKTLLSLHGKDTFDSMLDILNSYKGRSGKEYKSDYSAMDAGSWVVKEAVKPKLNGTSYASRDGSRDRRTKDIHGVPVKNPYEGKF